MAPPPNPTSPPSLIKNERSLKGFRKQNGSVLELFSRFRRGSENRGFNGIQKFFRRTISNNKGPFIFYKVGGAGGIWGGACEKKWLSRGGHPKKIREKGGSREIF